MTRVSAIALCDAVLGAKVRLPTLDGAAELSFPPNTSSGRAFLKIVLPDGKDAELEELMKKWREEKPYDPRKDQG